MAATTARLLTMVSVPSLSALKAVLIFPSPCLSSRAPKGYPGAEAGYRYDRSRYDYTPQGYGVDGYIPRGGGWDPRLDYDYQPPLPNWSPQRDWGGYEVHRRRRPCFSRSTKSSSSSSSRPPVCQRSRTGHETRPVRRRHRPSGRLYVCSAFRHRLQKLMH